jgi:hypothetical protein
MTAMSNHAIIEQAGYTRRAFYKQQDRTAELVATKKREGV